MSLFSSLCILLLLLFSLSSSQSWNSFLYAYIYPGTPGCNQATALTASKPHMCSVEYFTTTRSGDLILYDETLAGCFGYTPSNAALVRSNCREAFITISADEGAKMEGVVANPTVRARNIGVMKNMLDSIGFDGIELNFEASSSWSAIGYANFKLFLTELKAAIAPRKVVFTFPAVIPAEENLYPWRYDDLEPYLDHMVIMGYDLQYDAGVGSPISTYAWTKTCSDLLKARIGNAKFASKVIWGINSYGYVGTPGSFSGFRLLTFDQMTRTLSNAGLSMSQGVRDSTSGDVRLNSGGLVYYWADAQSMVLKRQYVEGLGASRVAVWHLGGGNPWFSGTEPNVVRDGVNPNPNPPTPPSPPTANNGTNYRGLLRADSINHFSFVPPQPFRIWANNATNHVVAVKISSTGGVSLSDIDVFLHIWNGRDWSIANSWIGLQNGGFNFRPNQNGWYMYSIVNRGQSAVNYEFALRM